MTKKAKLLILPLLVLMIICALTACNGKSYTITFDTQGGSEMASITLKEGDEITLPENPTKEGYTFDGWKLGDEGFTATEMPEQDITLVAKWTAVNYTVIYNLDNGTNGSNPSTYNIETETITLANATKEGYSFVGWFDAATGGSEVETIAKGSTGDKELYARFTANTDTAYTVEHYQQNLADNGYNIVSADTDSLAGTTGAATAATANTYVGFTVKTIEQETIAADGSTVVKVYYDRNVYAVTFVVDEAKGEYAGTLVQNLKHGATVTAPTVTAKAGYTYDGWNAEPAATATENVTYTAQFSTNTYNITYHLNGGTNYENAPAGFTIESETITLGTPTKAGYTFGGWYANAEYTGDAVTTIAQGTTTNVVLYAKWTANKHQLSFVLGYITQETAPAAMEVTYDAEYGTLPTVARTGYTFDGWYIGETKIESTTKVAITADSTATAKWTAIEYAIIYHLDGGTNNSANPDKYTIETETITLANASKTGYTFLGWYANAEYTGDAVTTIAQGTTNNVVLYARWTQFTFTSTTTEITITGYKGSDAELVIPSTIRGLPVTAIASNAFENNKTLTSVTIPASVTILGSYAFENCHALKTVNFAAGSQLNVIGQYAFSYCYSLTSIDIPSSVTTMGAAMFYYCTSLTTVNFADGKNLAAISSYAFSGCFSLTSVKIPEGVTSIGIRSFSGCNSLASVTMPSSLESIGEYAFYNCYVLTTVTLPKNLTTIGNNAFYCCYTLAEVYDLSDAIAVTKGTTDNGCVGQRAKDVYTTAEGATSKLSTVGDFVLHTEGSVVTLVAYLGNDAIVNIPSTVTVIGANSFYFNRNVVSFTIPSSVTSIGSSAFYGCLALAEVYDLSDGIAVTKGADTYGYVGYYAKDVYTAADAVSKLSDGKDGFIVHTDGTLVSYVGNAANVVFPDGVITIGKNAFYFNRNVVSVTIPSSVTVIDTSAFAWCTSLKTVTFGGENPSLKTIGISAFSNCHSLTSIDFPDSVTSIGGSAFHNCSSLATVTFGAGSQLNLLGENAFFNCPSLRSIVIPSGVTSIGTNTFHFCSSLTVVYYGGTAEDWAKVTIVSGGNDKLTTASIYYYSATQPAAGDTGNYWHYVDGVLTAWTTT